MGHWTETEALDIPSEIRDNPEIQKTPDAATALRNLIETRSMVGKAIIPPGENATDEERTKFNERLEGLGFAPADAAPEKPGDYTVDAEGDTLNAFLDARRKQYHEQGIGKRTAEKMLKADGERFVSSVGEIDKAELWAQEQLGEDWDGAKAVKKAMGTISNPDGFPTFAEVAQAAYITLPDGRRASLSAYPELIDMFKERGEKVGEDGTMPDGKLKGDNTPDLPALRAERDALLLKTWNGSPADADFHTDQQRLKEVERQITLGETGIDTAKLTNDEINQAIAGTGVMPGRP